MGDTYISVRLIVARSHFHPGFGVALGQNHVLSLWNNKSLFFADASKQNMLSYLLVIAVTLCCTCYACCTNTDLLKNHLGLDTMFEF